MNKLIKVIKRHKGGFKTRECPNCNHQYQTDERYTEETPYCGECGMIIEDNSHKFCGWCGKELNWEKARENKEDIYSKAEFDALTKLV